MNSPRLARRRHQCPARTPERSAARRWAWFARVEHHLLSLGGRRACFAVDNARSRLRGGGRGCPRWRRAAEQILSAEEEKVLQAASAIYAGKKGFDYPLPIDALRAYGHYPDLAALT